MTTGHTIDIIDESIISIVTRRRHVSSRHSGAVLLQSPRGVGEMGAEVRTLPCRLGTILERRGNPSQHADLRDGRPGRRYLPIVHAFRGREKELLGGQREVR